MTKLWNKLSIKQKALLIIGFGVIVPTVILSFWLNFKLQSTYQQEIAIKLAELKDGQAITAAFQAMQRSILYWLAALAAVISLLALTAGFVISRSITIPLSKIVKTMNEIAEGNLTARVQLSSQDELGTAAKAFNIAILKLQVLSSLVRQAALRVAGTSDKLSVLAEQGAASTRMVARSMEDLAKGNVENSQLLNSSVDIINQLIQTIENVAAGAQEQARDINHTTANTSGMAKKISEVSERTEGLKKAALQNMETAQSGRRSVDQSVEAMNRIKTAVLESADKITQLGLKSQQIGEIVEMIEEIAEQTNLLALNASIEAARAGEHGKGFAVVADEVRNLAERSRAATKEISTLIGGIRKETEEAVRSMAAGTEKVVAGVEVAQDAGKTLEEIVKVAEMTGLEIQNIIDSIAEVLGSSEEVAKASANIAAITQENCAATEEMAAGSKRVSASVENIAAVIEESSAATQQVFASAEDVKNSNENIALLAGSLKKTGDKLQGLVGQFKL